MNEEHGRQPEQLCPQKTALVVIDLQKGIAGGERAPHSIKKVIGNAADLVRTFTEREMFTALVRVSSTDGQDWFAPKTDVKRGAVHFSEGWDQFVPEIDVFKKTHRITKRQWGAFYGTDLDLQLRRRGIDTIVLCGVSTGIGVDTTAREAYARGYEQIFVEDAMTAVTAEEHHHAVTHIFPRIGRVRTSREVKVLLGKQES